VKEILVDEDELAQFLHRTLIEMGYVPIEEEVEDIVMLVFEYLESKGMEMLDKDADS
jgi:hypothetical protein